MAEAAFKLLSLSSWYIRSLSASGNCKKFCIARRFTSRDWDAVLGSSSFRRISESNPYRGKETQGELAACSSQGEGSVLPLSMPLRKGAVRGFESLSRNLLAPTAMVEKRASIVSFILWSICFTCSRNWAGLIGLLLLSSLSCCEIFHRKMAEEVRSKWNLQSKQHWMVQFSSCQTKAQAANNRHKAISRRTNWALEEDTRNEAATHHPRLLKLCSICYSLISK